jgi:alpha-glucosidase
VNPDLGTRRARAAAMLTFCLPGDVYIYQGDELGLAEVEDIPDELLQDPVWERSGHTDRGRDGCRVPLPWSGTEPSFGFSSTGRSWLPQPAAWKALTAEAESGDPDSHLSLYRHALALRRASIVSLPPDIAWLDAPDQVLAFRRGDLACVLNFSGMPVAIDSFGDIVLTSDELEDGLLAPNTCAWFTT